MKTTKHVEEIPLWNIILDVLIICFFLNATPIFQDYSKPFKRGFFCDDETIRYPYKGSTVHDPELYSMTVLVTIMSIIAMETWQGRGKPGRVLLAGWAAPAWAAKLVRRVLLFGFGLGAEEVLINMAKHTVGRLRPHFLDVCKPSVQCNATGMDPHAYITDYECTGEEGFAMFQSRLSFPSGHSAISFYGAMFTVIYLERRIRWPKRLIVYKTAFEVLVMATAIFCALSRIPDFKHHGEDVLAGSCFGAGLAWFWVSRVLRVGTEDQDENISSTSEANTFVFSSDDNNPEEKL